MKEVPLTKPAKIIFEEIMQYGEFPVKDDVHMKDRLYEESCREVTKYFRRITLEKLGCTAYTYIFDGDDDIMLNYNSLKDMY